MVRRPLHPEDIRLWSLVTATVRPTKGRQKPQRPGLGSAMSAPQDPPMVAASPRPAPTVQQSLPKSSDTRPNVISPVPRSQPRQTYPDLIEPRRKRRISMAREPIGARLDLHGLDQDRARIAVHSFILRAHADGLRAVLIITGKGSIGDGVLRRRTPDWLAEPIVRPMVAGLSAAERHHGGEGALYVALKRNVRS